MGRLALLDVWRDEDGPRDEEQDPRASDGQVLQPFLPADSQGPCVNDGREAWS